MGPACQWRGARERLSGTLWVGPASREWSGGVRGELSRAGLSTVAGWAEVGQAGLRSGEGKGQAAGWAGVFPLGWFGFLGLGFGFLFILLLLFYF